jgi:hypothetical protein
MYLPYQTGDELIDVQSIIDSDPLLVAGIKENTATNNYLKSNAFPNPFNDGITLQYTLSEDANVSVEMTDILGRKIQAFQIGKQTEGDHVFDWNGTDSAGKKLAAGVYFYKIKANDFSIEHKIIKQN